MLARGRIKYPAFFVEGVGWGGGSPAHLDQCLLTKVCHGVGVRWPSLQEHVGIQVLAGTISMVRRGTYGGVAGFPPELEGLAQVVEWRQVKEYEP